HDPGPRLSFPHERTNDYSSLKSHDQQLLLGPLREALGGKSEPQYIHTAKRQRYGLSSDTWTKGRKELEAQGLLAVKREPQGDFYDFMRLRNAYQLTLARLEGPPYWS
ncbi:hypothetical protein ABWI13_30105, partial [Streptomyces koyangensis]|uniref:hypothetical protein n=1 Tax=Streptomyces koyangensis TaxID=188770 RepID=UPI003393ADBF